MENVPFLQAISISKLYTGDISSGVKNIDLNIKSGIITAIIGQSGSGKSTLLRLLYGLLSPDEGTVQFNGERIWGPEEKLIPGHDEMKMVTQHTDDLNLYARVWDNVAVMLPNTNVKIKEEKTDLILTQLNMQHLAKKRVADLSGGEKQRVAIARAIITQPKILLLDEPFNQVDASFREGLQHDIREIVKQTGLTVIMVSHDPAEVLSMADELLVLQDGEITEAGHPKLVYQTPKQLYTASLLANCNILSAEEALLCGITTHKETVVIYPEWIRINPALKTNNWVISQILFKGFYEDIILENRDVILRIINYENDKYKAGDEVALEIKRWLEY
ncbi:ABC transporter ATP-binding protein [Mucilaginibacter segetis]|uniref:ABC transporter ATP-binding protein n=1 Tax=Mucilaginibacter segetis TaxID=2793071 RepID=A0A934PQ76_9SPHI|nr:ABC transporter ATP-binding protein [Mucilaginibacter segetis]MBK0378089.1 ABC transporter ATP-binding protein [Mucilaginibacter segetis]